MWNLCAWQRLTLQPPRKKPQPRACYSVPVSKKAKQLEEKQAALLDRKKTPQGIIDFASDSEHLLTAKQLQNNCETLAKQMLKEFSEKSCVENGKLCREILALLIFK